MPMSFPGGQPSHANGRPFTQEETKLTLIRMIPGSSERLTELLNEDTSPERRLEVAKELAASAHKPGGAGDPAVELVWGLHDRLPDAKDLFEGLFPIGLADFRSLFDEK